MRPATKLTLPASDRRRFLETTESKLTERDSDRILDILSSGTETQTRSGNRATVAPIHVRDGPASVLCQARGKPKAANHMVEIVAARMDLVRGPGRT